MSYLSGQTFRLLSARFQFMAQADLPEGNYWTTFYKETMDTWTVIFTPVGQGFKIYLCIMLTHDPINANDPIFTSMLKNYFPEQMLQKFICVFQIDQDFQIIDKKWIPNQPK